MTTPRRSAKKDPGGARDEPPYLRIAADLRNRISKGELRAGERVPSTRQLQKTWGVALVTASKALTTLRHEGLLRAEPRFGYIVAPLAAPRRSTDSAIRGGAAIGQRVVRAAIEIADAEGLAALSMRGVAARIGIPTMSLYRHVESRDALLLLMIDAVFGARPLPSCEGHGWRALLETAARVQWQLCRTHPWLPHVMTLTRPMILPNVVKYADWVFAAMDGLPIDAATKLFVHMTLYGYVRGVAVDLDSERQAEAETGLTEQQWMDTQASALAAVARSPVTPAFARILHELTDGFDPELDRVFEFGLQPLLDGLEKVMNGSAPGPH
jgi:DNA-binding transcriptional regulator YhcF (GntR family)